MDENKTTCPCCPNQCEAGALQCGKGRAYFRNEDNGGSERSNRNESEDNHHQGEGRQNHGGRRELGNTEEADPWKPMEGTVKWESAVMVL